MVIEACLTRKTRFNEYFIEYNGLNERGFEEWAFYPGMLFSSIDKWWGDWGNRDKPHEGLDLCLYRDKDGNNNGLDATVKVPVMYDGKVVRIIDDFLGKSVCVIHDIHDGKENQLYTIYGHTEPLDGINRGAILSEGSVIATITNPRREKVNISPHLHISIAWMPKSLPYERLTWETISNSSIVTLLNPLKVIDCEYTVMRHG